MLSIKNVSSQRAKLNSLVVYRDHEIQRWRPPKFRIQISLKDTTSTDVTVLDFIAKRSPLAPERTGSCDDPMKRKVQQLGYSSTPWPSHGTSLTSSRGCTVSLIWFISFSFLSSFFTCLFFISFISDHRLYFWNWWNRDVFKNNNLGGAWILLWHVKREKYSIRI